MPRTGAELSVRMSNAGEFGWVTDREGGYRYQTTHPETGKTWPPIPDCSAPASPKMALSISRFAGSTRRFENEKAHRF
jgi:alkylated DNA repair dioxygenase AlkB